MSVFSHKLIYSLFFDMAFLDSDTCESLRLRKMHMSAYYVPVLRDKEAGEHGFTFMS